MKKTPTSPSAGTRPCHHDTCLTALAAIIMMLATSLRAAAANGDDSLIPDSMLTEDKVYELTFTDPDLAHRIVDAMRERTDISDYDLNILDGDLYVNNHKPVQALVYYRRTLSSDSVKSNAGNHMEVLHRMITCYDYLADEENKMRCAKQLLSIAEAEGDEAMQAIARFTIGKSFYQQRNTEEGFKYMRQAVETMEESDYKYKWDNLRYEYNTLIVYYIREYDWDEALAMTDSLERIVTASGDEPAIDGLEGKERKTLLALRAVILSSMGRDGEARRCYDEWRGIKGYNQDDYLMMPYLFGQKMYDEIIDTYREHEQALIEGGDTTNYHMATVYKNMAKAYEMKGKWRAAAYYYERLAALRETLKREEQRTSVLELAAIYELNEKNEIINEGQRRMLITKFVISGFVIVTALLAALLWLAVHKRRSLHRQNLLMAQQMQHYAELAEQYHKRLLSSPAPAARDNAGGTTSLFDSLEQMMLKDKPYLNPQLSRDDMVAALYTNKNKLIDAIKTARGMTFTDYVNSLRLEEAVRLLAEHPELTIEQVGTRAGFGSAATFYRQFKSTYGMSPKDYILYARHIEASRADTDGNTDRGGVK